MGVNPALGAATQLDTLDIHLHTLPLGLSPGKYQTFASFCKIPAQLSLRKKLATLLNQKIRFSQKKREKIPIISKHSL